MCLWDRSSEMVAYSQKIRWPFSGSFSIKIVLVKLLSKWRRLYEAEHPEVFQFTIMKLYLFHITNVTEISPTDMIAKNWKLSSRFKSIRTFQYSWWSGGGGGAFNRHCFLYICGFRNSLNDMQKRFAYLQSDSSTQTKVSSVVLFIAIFMCWMCCCIYTQS